MNAPSQNPQKLNLGPDPIPVSDEELAVLAPELTKPAPVELDILAPENLDAYLAVLEAEAGDPNAPGFLERAGEAAGELVSNLGTGASMTGQNLMAGVGSAIIGDGQGLKDSIRRQTALTVQAGAMFAGTYPVIGEMVKGAFKEVGTKMSVGYKDTPENRRKVAAVRQARDRTLRDISNITEDALMIADYVVGGMDLQSAYAPEQREEMMKAAAGLAEVGDLAFAGGAAAGAKLGRTVTAAGARNAAKAAASVGADKVADLIENTTKYAGSLEARFYRAAAAAAGNKVPNFGALTEAGRKIVALQEERIAIDAMAESLEKTNASAVNAAKMAEQKAIIEKIQQDLAKRADEAALAANTRPVSQQVAGAAVQFAGEAATTVGRKTQAAVDWLRDRRVSALGESKEAAELGDEMMQRATGVSPGFVEKTAEWVADLGENVSTAGKLMRTAESSTPYFQRLAKETDGWTRLAAQQANRVEFISRIGRGVAEATDGAVKGAAVGAVFGTLQGDAAEGAGEGFIGGFFGGGLRTIQLERSASAVRARQIGDIAEARSRRTGMQQRMFDEAPAGVQLAAATFEATNPNLVIDFVRQKGSGGSYVVNPDGTGVATIDLDSKIPLVPLMSHEVTHHIARNPDIAADIRSRFFGDAATNSAGIFTEIKDGSVQFKTDFAKFRDKYLKALRGAGKDTTKYEANPELILHEVIAEAGISSLLAKNVSGEFAGIGALRRNARPLVPIIEQFARSPMVMDSGVLQRVLMATGAVFREDGQYASGTGLFDTEMSPEMRKAVRDVIKQYDLMRLSERAGQVQSFSEIESLYSEQELLSNPELMDLVSSGFDVDIDPETGKRKFLTAREAKRREQEFIDDLLTALDASPDISPGRVRATLTKDGRTIYTGKYIPADVLETLQAKNKYNPRQLEMLAMITDTLKNKPGAEAHFVYQPGMTRGSRLYKQRAVTNRVETPISILISRTGGILVNTISQEKVMRNLEFFARKGQLNPWAGDVRAARADLLRYMDNTVSGREGADGIGLEKRDALNALFGQLTQVQRERNPVLQGMSEAQGRKLGVVQSRRLDRINQMKILGSAFRADYGRVSEDLRPEENSQLEGFGADMASKVRERIRNTPRTDYSPGDVLYTPSGAPVKFISDLLTVAKGKNEGLQRAYVEMRDGSKGEMLLKDLSPEPPKVSRDIGTNVEFAVPPSDEDARAALSSEKKPKYGAARQLEPGTEVGLRIDIPAFQRTGNYVVAVHQKAKGNTVGKIVGYDNIVSVDNPTFMANEAGAKRIRQGESNKFPIATVEGNFNPDREIPKDINEWTAVGFDPLDHSYFYDKRTDEPVVGGKQAVSIGNTVFVKDPVYGDRADYMYRPEQIDTPEFKRWFGDSKVVDGYGLPKVVFHGAPTEFTVFDPSKARYSKWGGIGSWFSEDPSYANSFRGGFDSQGNKTIGPLLEVYLSLKEPAVYEGNKGFEQLIRDYESITGVKTNRGTPETNRKFVDKMKELGFDGIVVKNHTADAAITPEPQTFYVAFDPTQIKSATDNVGTFDPNNPDYMYRPESGETGLEIDLKNPLWESALNVYGNKAAGFWDRAGNTNTFSKTLRRSQGLKLWEDMTPEERVAEFRSAAIRDLRVAAQEATNPTDYLLDRALDPLDPLNGVYKALLVNAGAELKGDAIRVPSSVRQLLDNESTNPLLRLRNNSGQERRLEGSEINYRPEAKDIDEVAQQLGLEKVGDGAKKFGYFMQQMGAKGITPRDVVKAYLITTSSINRGALSTEKVRGGWSDLVHDEDRLRPEDAFAKLLGTREGQAFLDAAERGEFDEAAANTMLEKFKPFGLYNTQREYMRNAAENLSKVGEAIVDAVENMPTEEYAEFVRENFKGISFGKVGFMSGMLGRGDLPTVDVRQRKLHYGDQKFNVDKQILLEVRDRLANLGVFLTEDLKPFYQTIVHHAVWDRLEGTDTSHADIKEAMLQFRPDPTQPKSEVDKYTKAEKIEAPSVSLKDLVGKRIFPIEGDLTMVGTYRGIDSAVVLPVPAFGGPGFAAAPQNVKTGVVWANDTKGKQTQFKNLAADSDYAVIIAQDQKAHTSNTTTVTAFLNTLDAYIRDGRIGKRDLERADVEIRKAAAEMGVTVPSITDPSFIPTIRDATFPVRKRIVTKMESSTFEEFNFPPAKRIIDELRQPEYHGVGTGDALLLVKVDPDAEPIKLGENGTAMHPDYDWGIAGKLIGKFDSPVPFRLLFKDFIAERRKNPDDKGPSHDFRSITSTKPIVTVTDEIAGQAANLAKVGAVSKRQMQAALAAATGSWMTSDDAKNEGGVSIADFARALRSNKSAPSLTPYTEEMVKAKVKSGEMTVYKLQNAEIYFALVNDGDKRVISSVVNNEPGARGVAAPAVLSKAIEQGATHLDCFAVLSAKHPTGFLPELYNFFGFEDDVDNPIGARVNFDRKYFDADWKAVGQNPDIKFADLLRLWQSEGWNPSTPEPQVTFMRLRQEFTDDDARQNYSRRLLETPAGELAELRRATRRSGQPNAQPNPAGAGAGGAGGNNAGANRGVAGNRRGVSDSIQRSIDNYRAIVREIGGLSDQDAIARGLDIEQMKRLREVLNPTGKTSKRRVMLLRDENGAVIGYERED